MKQQTLEVNKLVLTKQELWERIRTKSVWLYGPRTPIFVAGEEHMNVATDVLAKLYMRYIIMMLFQGNGIAATSGQIEKLEEDATYTMKISDVQIQPAAMPQIPNGGLDIESPFMSIEGGTNLYGRVAGNSINLTVVYWDDEI